MLKKAFIAFMDHFEGYICQILLVFFVTILMIQILLRWLGMPLTWSEEVARYSFLWFIMFGACYATRLSALNRVTLHIMYMPTWMANALLIIGDIFWFVFNLAMAWYGYLSIQELLELPYYTPGLDWNLAYIYMVFPFSFLLMAIRVVQVDVCKYILKWEIIDPDKASVEESKRALMDCPEDDPACEEVRRYTECSAEEEKK